MDDEKHSRSYLRRCNCWFNKLNVNIWSRFAYYPACKALNETSVVIRVSRNDRLVVILRFKKPWIELIPETDARYDAVSKLGSPYPPDTYNPDALGFYLPYDTVVDGVVLDSGIYIHVDKIIEYWKTTLSNQVFFNVNTLLALVFYHEYFHMIMDKLGISSFYQDRKGFKVGQEILNYNEYEEVLAEFYALSNTLFDSLLLDSWGVDLGRSICDPVENINSEIEASEELIIKASETIAYQPISCTKFVSLKRPYPYNLVGELWNEYLFNELLKKLIKYSVYTGLDSNPVNALNAVARIRLVDDPHKFLFKKVSELLTGMNYPESTRENEVDVYVYLLGVDWKEIVKTNFTCSDLA